MPQLLSGLILPNDPQESLDTNAAGLVVPNPLDNRWDHRTFNGLETAAFDPACGTSGYTPVAQVLHLIALPVHRNFTFGTIHWAVFTAGATVTNGRFGIYSSAGTLIAQAAAQSTALQSTGNKSATLVAEAGQSLAVVGGPTTYVWGAILIGAATTMPQIYRGTSNYGWIGMTVAPRRFQEDAAVGTALPATTLPANNTNYATTSGAMWLGLS